MRFTKTKPIERFFKNLYNYSYIGKLLHYLRNRNRPNAVFIWIPKNAGTSLNLALQKYGSIKAKKLARIKYRFSQRGLVTFDHIDYHQLVEHGYVNKEFDETAYKFCFCRNPYDRAVSLYVYMTKNANPKPSFLEFWQGLKQNGIGKIGLYNHLNMSMCNPQLRWIENIKIDFTGRYENLEEDIDRLMKELKLPPLNLPHHNRSTRKGLGDYFCPESKKIIETLYAEDFEYFGYEIESDDRVLNSH